MRFKTPASLLLLTCLLFLVGGCQPNTSETTPADPVATEAEPDGAALYLLYCAACHGPDGLTMANSTAPNLASQELLKVIDDDFLTASTAFGRPGPNVRGRSGFKMSAYAESERGPLTDLQIAAIVAHIRSWQVEPSIDLDPSWQAAGDVVAGEALWIEHCAECHGEDGWGEDAPRLVGSTFQEHASDDLIRQTLIVGRPDGEMPAYEFTDAEMGDLIVFIRKLGQDNATP